MATRNKAKTPDELFTPAADEPQQVVIPAEDDPDDVAIMNLMASLGEQEAMVHIYRQGDNARDLELLDGVPVQNFDVMMLASEPFNGGSFRIHVRSKGGLVANRFIKVKGKPKPAVTQEAMTPQTIAAIVAETVRAAIPAAPVQPAAPAVDPFEMMLKMSEMMRNLQPPAPAAPAVAAAPVKSLTEQIADISAIVNLSKTLGAGGDPETSVMTTLLEKGGDILGAIAAAKATQGTQPVQAMQPVAPVAPMLANPVSINPEQEQAAMFEKQMVKFALSKACAAAANNDDVEDFAGKYYEDIPAKILHQIVTDPEWFRELCNIYPDCATYEPWFTSLRALLVQWVSEDAAAEAAVATVDTAPGSVPASSNVIEQGAPSVQAVPHGNHAASAAGTGTASDPAA